MKDIASGETIVISQKLGAGSEACNLHPGGLALACGLVEEAIERGADVVVLSNLAGWKPREAACATPSKPPSSPTSPS